MTAKKIWESLNVENPEGSFLKELLSLPSELRHELLSLYCDALEKGNPEEEWAIIHWTRYAEAFDPDAYYGPVLKAVKDLVRDCDRDELLDTYLYNSLTCFLEGATMPKHEEKLLLEWKTSEDEDWRTELLALLAKAQAKDPEVIERMVAEWDEDPVSASFYLYDYSHPRLIQCAGDYIQYFGPWQKYIWSKVEIGSFGLSEWVEVTSAWVAAKFPEEYKPFDLKLSPMESLENWIRNCANEDQGSHDYVEESREYLRWREEKIDQYFLSDLPADWRDWIFTAQIDPETRADFQQELIDAGLFKVGSVSKNGPCPCGSGRKAKRCCFRSE